MGVGGSRRARFSLNLRSASHAERGSAPVNGLLRVGVLPETQPARDNRAVFLTPRSPSQQYFALPGREPMWARTVFVDAIFIIAVIVLYALTHWIVRALSRLGGIE